ncbi:MAG: hypothetical protein K1X86_15370 [Ignavibacteria bacterium]|nr:hypothetical protein [Ignavibacteria bacterium]
MEHKIIISFDLHEADDEDYALAYTILADYNLEKYSLNKKLDLPDTTVMGTMNSEYLKATDLRDYFWRLFKDNGLKPKRLIGGILEDWAVKEDSKL